MEPVHVHIAKGSPTADATKVWITSTGSCLLCNNHSRTPDHILRNLIRMIEARSHEVMDLWIQYFNEIRYYC